MRLKQICNFDPKTGESAKLDMLMADMEEVALSNRKAIIFSQWVEPIEKIAKSLKPFGPVIATRSCQPISRSTGPSRKSPRCTTACSNRITTAPLRGADATW